MRQMRKAIESYGDVKVSTGVATADSVQLIQMLFDGLMESLKSAEGQIRRGAIEEKSKSLGRASKIVLGLQGALDFNAGGEIARNLDELYGYVTRRLLHVNLHNDLEALAEVTSLISEIQDAWGTIPSVLNSRPAPVRLAS
ncbi:MAG: Flagellar protein FliS [Pseudomonadota bacterium]|jgi:flagellar secretion chaperone FliS